MRQKGWKEKRLKRTKYDTKLLKLDMKLSQKKKNFLKIHDFEEKNKSELRGIWLLWSFFSYDLFSKKVIRRMLDEGFVLSQKK